MRFKASSVYGHGTWLTPRSLEGSKTVLLFVWFSHLTMLKVVLLLKWVASQEVNCLKLSLVLFLLYCVQPGWTSKGFDGERSFLWIELGHSSNVIHIFCCHDMKGENIFLNWTLVNLIEKDPFKVLFNSKG